MTQVVSGLRSILSQSAVYNTFQTLMGGGDGRKEIISYLDLQKNDRVLDIGCGTAEILQNFPEDVVYTGFDASEEYIMAAQKRYGNRGTFISKLVTESLLYEYENFDKVLALGLLHHLDDNEVQHVFQLAKKALNKGGTFLSVDGCYVKGQSLLSKFMIDNDRGQNVRKLDEYAGLAKNIFEHVTIYHRNDLLRIPYDHVVLVCR